MSSEPRLTVALAVSNAFPCPGFNHAINPPPTTKTTTTTLTRQAHTFCLRGRFGATGDFSNGNGIGCGLVELCIFWFLPLTGVFDVKNSEVIPELQPRNR